MSSPPPDLVGLLEEAASFGFLGRRAAVADHIDHALGFGAAVESPPVGRCVDLGSGAGLPGLVLSVVAWPESRWALVEAMGKRAAFLRRAVASLGIEERVEVVAGRIEDLVRQGELPRAETEFVTARGFGPPPLVAEAAAPLLQVGGVLVVSEPPGTTGARWDGSGLSQVGLAFDRVVTGLATTYAVLRQSDTCPERYPRALKAQKRSPLFHVEHPEGA